MLNITTEPSGDAQVLTAGTQDGYLDKYAIKESVEDKTTLRLRYTHAPNKICLPPELLESEFLNIAEAEGIGPEGVYQAASGESRQFDNVSHLL